MKFLEKYLNVFKRKQTSKPVTYLEKIRELVHNNKVYPAKEINKLESEAVSNYYEDKIDEIVELVKKIDFDTIKKRFNSTPKTFADLSYFSYYDESNEKFVAIIFDSDELWQDPEILDIVKIP